MTTPRFQATLSIRGALLAAVLLSPTAPSVLQAAPGEARAMIQLPDNSRRTGFIQNSNEQAIQFSTDQGVPGQAFALNQIKIAFLEANEIMASGRQAYNRADYKTAATEFGRVSDEYKTLAFIPDNFACEARYYQLDCLRRLGDLKAMADLQASPVTKNIPTKLNETYRRPFQFLGIWAAVGADQWDSIKGIVANAQVPVTGDMKMLSAPVWQKMSLGELSQMAYLRGKILEKEGNTRAALDDYWRAATLTQGNDPAVRNLAIQGAMGILKANPKIAAGPENNPALWELQSAAWVYKKAFNKGEAPLGFGEYAIKPQMPEVPMVKAQAPEEDAAAKPTETAPPADPKAAPKAADPKAAAPADAKKAEPPAKAEPKK